MKDSIVNKRFFRKNWTVKTIVECKDCYSAWHVGEEPWCECDELEGEE